MEQIKKNEIFNDIEYDEYDDYDEYDTTDNMDNISINMDSDNDNDNDIKTIQPPIPISNSISNPISNSNQIPNPTKSKQIKLKSSKYKSTPSTPSIDTTPSIPLTNTKNTIPTKTTKTTSIPTNSVNKAEDKFEYNNENIIFFSKDLDFKSICIKHRINAVIPNDTKLTCLLLRLNIFKEYHCTREKCKVGKLWNGQPIQLLLNRKNNNSNDLTIANLELICPNCFMITYGLEIFKKKEKEAIFNCEICQFPLTKFMNGRKKKGICLACEKQMCRLSHEKEQVNYFSKLQDTYNDNPILSDDIKNTKYYNEVSKYKKFDSKDKQNIKVEPSSASASASSIKYTNANTANTANTTNNIPLIKLNMNIPDLEDLLE